MTKLYKNHVKSPIIPASSLGIRTIAELLKVPRVSRRFQVPPIGFLCPSEDQIEWDVFFDLDKTSQAEMEETWDTVSNLQHLKLFFLRRLLTLHTWGGHLLRPSSRLGASRVNWKFSLTSRDDVTSLWLQSFQHPNNLQAHLDQGMSTKS